MTLPYCRKAFSLLSALSKCVLVSFLGFYLHPFKSGDQKRCSLLGIVLLSDWLPVQVVILYKTYAPSDLTSGDFLPQEEFL